MRKDQGFTIVEMLLVIAIIAILFAIVTSSFASVTAEARDSERITDVNAIHSHLELFRSNNGYYPFDETLINSSEMPGLSEEALIDPRGNEINDGGYSYAPTPIFCVLDGCSGYELSTILERGPDHIKINIQ